MADDDKPALSLDAMILATAPKDCRTCEHFRQEGIDPEGCDFWPDKPCILGSRYVPTEPVRLWRTE